MPANSLLRNGAANLVGKAWNAIMALAFVPLYIHLLGIEAYGLVGFFATLQSIFTVFDLGLSTTLNRQLALLSLDLSRAQEARNLVRTLEVIYWLVALGIALLTAVLAPWAAISWINARSLPTAIVSQSVVLMGIAIALQFPFAFYSGGLLGLQRQVVLNAILIGASTLRTVGTVAVLWYIAPSIVAFFIWQAIVSAIQTVICAWAVWKNLPIASRPHFQRDLLKKIWRFAAGMTGISVASLMLAQLDKVIVSGLLPLESFGYYSLAAVVASGLYVLTTPLFSAVFPRLTQLVSLDDELAVIRLYHTSCQIMAAFVLPFGVVITLFAREVLLLWTDNPIIVNQSWLLVCLLVIGTTLNGLMTIPYALQLAYGWTRLAFYQNVIGVIVLVPLLIWAVEHYGTVGAACMWPILNSAYVLLGIQVMHRRLLPREKLRWYTQDVGLPLLGALLPASLALLLIPATLSRPLLALYIGTVLLASLIAAFAFTTLSGNRIWWRILSLVRGG